MKKCKNQLLAALIASTMAMSMTACSGASAETTKPSETAVTEKATETESESETAEAKEYDLDDVKDYVEGVDDYKIYIKDADKMEQKDLFKQMKKLVLEKAKGDDHMVKSVDVDFKESSDKDEKAKDIYEMRLAGKIRAVVPADKVLVYRQGLVNKQACSLDDIHRAAAAHGEEAVYLIVDRKLADLKHASVLTIGVGAGVRDELYALCGD